jgi:hypothetical protein
MTKFITVVIATTLKYVESYPACAHETSQFLRPVTDKIRTHSMLCPADPPVLEKIKGLHSTLVTIQMAAGTILDTKFELCCELSRFDMVLVPQWISRCLCLGGVLGDRDRCVSCADCCTDAKGDSLRVSKRASSDSSNSGSGSEKIILGFELVTCARRR